MSTTNVSTLDPVILAVFGNPPDGTDLGEEQYVGYDVVSCVVLGLAAAAVGLRFYVRLSHMAKLAIDDWTILIALVSSTIPEHPSPPASEDADAKMNQFSYVLDHRCSLVHLWLQQLLVSILGRRKLVRL